MDEWTQRLIIVLSFLSFVIFLFVVVFGPKPEPKEDTCKALGSEWSYIATKEDINDDRYIICGDGKGNTKSII
jgi:hypothetical protein